MSIKAVIFDLDGTITQPYFDFDTIREEMGLARDSGPVLESMEKMTPQQRQRAEEILHLHERRAVTESRLNAGARQTLSALRKAGVRIGILTRNKRSNALAIAQKHGLKFDAVVDREDGPVKPDAFGVQRICEQFGVKPQETLLVGDYLFDLLCAKAAGAVAVLLANHNRAAEFAGYADFTVEKIDQILQIVEDKK
ncbi:MAG: HAD family hydrolase [Planctomycetota bacterium]|jgi:HAD superfamily hydrolase (TIGR01509 family)